MQRRIGCLTGLLLAVLLGSGGSPAALAAGPRIPPGPHDEHHLVVVRPGELRDEKDAPAKTVEDLQASFDKKMTPITGPLRGDLRVRHAGEYVLWVRISQTIGKQTPVEVQLQANGKHLLKATVNADSGEPGRGGEEALAAYRTTAKTNTPKGAVASFDAGRFELSPDDEKKSTGKGKNTGKKPAKEDDLADDLLGELQEKPADPWAHLARVEEINDEQPCYWWKAGTVELTPGRVELLLSPGAALPKKPADAPRFDAAFLTTNDALTYPYTGDIDELRATFVRFRLDELPEAGVRLGADFQTHVLQYPRLSIRFGREVIGRDDLHTKPGYTCWYRLQDVERMPAATQHEIGMRVNVNAAAAINIPAKDFSGATQFASFPHPDYVVREFDWREPLGLNYTVALDVENYPHRLMTFRDHAREHYQTALAAAGTVSPLTRGELYFSTICGSLNSDDRDYLLKTQRLLGINSLCETADPGLGRKLFGWNSSYYVATMPMGDLFDEQVAKKHYDDYFRQVFATDQEGWKDTWSYCYMDEPGELYREQMTGPYWQFVEQAEQPYWFDPVGDSALHVKHTDLPDCVLEGVIERTTSIELRVGLNDVEKPTEYFFWSIGYPLGPALNANLAYGKYVEGATVPSVSYRMVRSIGSALGKLKFKIVYQQGVATLFINDRTIHQHIDLKGPPSFGINGTPKKIYALRLRPLKPGEGVKLEDSAGTDDAAAASLADAALEELELDDPPSWARPKSLRAFVEEDCVYAGGVPGAAEAFRIWLQEQGHKPEFFGQKSWEDIRPLTMPQLVRDEHEARLFYWSRRFSGQLTPRNFGLISEAIHNHAPNPHMWSYAALSGGSLYGGKQMPLDMIHVGSLGNTATGGVSDWMFYSSWRWDSHQAVAYSAELYNAGARRHGERPVSFPMMHCVAPTVFRSFTQLGAQVKLMSLYSYGPHYLDYPDSWAQSASCYDAITRLTSKSAAADDILAPGLRRPSRVALLYTHSSEYWSTRDSFDDRRATFLALSHEYYQPEVITEQQVQDGALAHYDALYVVDRHVAQAAQSQIADWVKQGGLLWCCADALTRDEYDQPADLPRALAGIERTWADDAHDWPETPAAAPPAPGPIVSPADKVTKVSRADKVTKFRPHTVLARGLPETIKAAKGNTVRATYADGRPAWCERPIGQGRLVYIGHRAGATYTSKNNLVDGHRELWADTGRELLAAPLHERKVSRDLILSETAIMASPITSDAGTAIVLYNMRPSPRSDLTIQLREPQRPAGVTRLAGAKLEEIPFDYEDGSVSIKLAALDEGDIIYVRGRPAAEDDRLEVMRRRTEQQLQAADVERLSAGAWLAGFYPDWDLAGQIAPLADHADWRVRRAAAESLGRLQDAAAGERLAALSAGETDPHVLAEQLHALSVLRYPGLAQACQRHLADTRFVVRQAALAALADAVTGDSDSSNSAEWNEAALAAAQEAIVDVDQRVRQEAMRILATLDPPAAAQLALAAFDSRETPTLLDRPLWAAALAARDAAWEAVLRQSPQPSLPLLLELAQRRRDLRLSAALLEQTGKVLTEQSYAWSLAMIRQRDPNTAKKLLAIRDKLPARVQYYLPIVLESTFEAGLGNVVEDWEEELGR